jgi:glucose/mannose transport system permease protein
MRRVRRWGPGLLLVSPSIVLVAVFVYGLIGWNVKVSLSDWRQAQHTSHWAGLAAYRDLNGDAAFRLNVSHLWKFTVVFIVGTLIIGWTLAFLLDKGVKGEGFFRSVYLFPMAISFIAAGIVWRWLMNPAPGDRETGLNVVLDKLGLHFLLNHVHEWYLGQDWGMAAMAMPAIWALSGYVMALFLAGFRGVPEELREAARMDGANEFRVYRHVVFPHLRPVTLSALIILGHISIKVFDLIVAIGGKQLITQVPAVYMWIQIYDARDYAKGAAIATLLLIGISVLIVPYLIYTVRSERNV